MKSRSNFYGPPQQFLAEVRKWVEENIPEGAREITVSLGERADYGDTYGCIELEFVRPSTQEEVEREKIEAARNKEWRRKQYESLKKEFDSGD